MGLQTHKQCVCSLALDVSRGGKIREELWILWRCHVVCREGQVVSRREDSNGLLLSPLFVRLIFVSTSFEKAL